MKCLNSVELVAAVRIWVGWEFGSWPNRSDERVVERFGSDIAAQLLPLIKSLERDFYSSDVRVIERGLQEVTTFASEQFKRIHPTVADEIVEAFAWCHSYDFK